MSFSISDKGVDDSEDGTFFVIGQCLHANDTIDCFYDEYGRVEKIKGNHHLSTHPSFTPKDHFRYYSYDFADNVLSEKQEFKFNTTADFVTIDSMTYDHAGRMTDHFFTIDGEQQLISRHAYTAKDELKQKQLGSTGADFLQSLDYTYLPNGFLKMINQPTTDFALSYPGCITGPTGGDTSRPTTPKDLFYLELSYDADIHTGIPSIQRKNGDISQMVWQTRGRDRFGYGFEYDYLNRLTQANYEVIRSDNELVTNQTNKYHVNISYTNALGDIATLQRHGTTNDNDPCGLPEMFDDMTYTYYPGTSRIRDISDVAEVAQEGYPAYDTGSADYTYDGNGNVTYDPSRKVHIIYNRLNLPDSLLFEDGRKVINLYDHTGTKLAQSEYTADGSLALRRDYIENIELVNGQVQAIYHDEGRVIKKDGPSIAVLPDTIRAHAAYDKYYYADKIISPSVVIGPLIGTGNVTFEARDSIKMVYPFQTVDNTGLDFEARIKEMPIDSSWQWEYVLRDHLGNIRISFADLDDDGVITVALDSTNEILEEHHYYPFGMKHKGPWLHRKNLGFSNRYNYNGKEEMPFAGYLYYGARIMDPSIARFSSIDPISDRFPHVSTFNYAENSPISNIDLHGLQALDQSSNFLAIQEAAAKQGKDPSDASTAHMNSRGERTAYMLVAFVALIVPGPEDLVIGGIFARSLGLLPRGSRVVKGLKNSDEIAEGRKFESEQLQKSIDEGLDVSGRNRLVPENGKGNVNGNRTDTDQLIKNDDGTFKVVETKRTSTTKTSKGQEAAKEHVENGNGVFETRTNQPSQGLKKGDKIKVTDYERRNKYDNGTNQ